MRHFLGLEQTGRARCPQQEAARARAKAEAKAAADSERAKARREASAACGRSQESLLQRLLRGPASSALADKAPQAAATAANDVIVISDSDDDEPARQPAAHVKGTERRRAVGGADAAVAPSADAASRGATASTAAAAGPAEQARHLCRPGYSDSPCSDQSAVWSL